MASAGFLVDAGSLAMGGQGTGRKDVIVLADIYIPLLLRITLSLYALAHLIERRVNRGCGRTP